MYVIAVVVSAWFQNDLNIMISDIVKTVQWVIQSCTIHVKNDLVGIKLQEK